MGILNIELKITDRNNYLANNKIYNENKPDQYLTKECDNCEYNQGAYCNKSGIRNFRESLNGTPQTCILKSH